MVETIGLTGLFLVLVISLIERSYKVYTLKKLLVTQSAQILAYKNKNEEFAMQMAQFKQNSENNAADPLTQLINKQAFDKNFNQLIAQSKRFNKLFAVLILNVNKLRDINNLYSQETKDKLLIEVGRRLKKTLRDVDIVSRYDDHTFIMLLPNMIKPEIIVHAVERMIQEVSLPFEIERHFIEASICVGIAIYPFDGEDKETLLANAKVALSKAKTDGRNVFEFYQEETQILGQQELRLKALVKSEDFFKNISLEFRPYYNTSSHEAVCIEVIATLNHPELGKVPFDQFVRIAHYSSRMFELYEWMIKSSIEKFEPAKTHKTRRFIFKFNLKQFDTPKFIEKITEIIKKVSSNDNEIIMDITDEGIDRANLDSFKDEIKKLNQSNIPIAIGILVLGHFSLNKINHLVFNYLKIDEKLVKDLNTREESQVILEKIMSLVSSLKISTLTTGVDTEEQKQILKNLGCEIMQGKVIKENSSEDFSI